MHPTYPSESFIVEQQFVDEFTIQSKSPGDSRSVCHSLHPQPMQDQQLGRGRVGHAGTLLAQPRQHVGASRTPGQRTVRSSASIATAHSLSFGRKDLCSGVSGPLVACALVLTAATTRPAASCTETAIDRTPSSSSWSTRD